MLFNFINEMFNFCIKNLVGTPIINKSLFYILSLSDFIIKPEINIIIFGNSDNVLKCLDFIFLNIPYVWIIFYFRW